MTIQEIEEKVKKAIMDKLGVEESKVTPQASFINDLGADSLDTVELVMKFEEEFDIKIPEELKAEIDTNSSVEYWNIEGKKIIKRKL